VQLRLGLTSKMALVFALFASVLVSGVGVLAYTRGRAALEAAAIVELRSTAIEKQTALENWIDKRRLDIALLAGSPHVLDSLAVFTAAGQRPCRDDRMLPQLRPRMTVW
jgi:hypothetical protein